MILEYMQQNIFRRKQGKFSAIVHATREIPSKILSVPVLVQKEQTGMNIGKSQKECMGNKDVIL